jgi:bifunctional non-homologous end joining protein LigD
MSTTIAPMLATATLELPRNEDAWGYEFKWDGVRAVVYIEGGKARAMSRNAKDFSDSYPELQELAAALGRKKLILDGELVAFDEAGRPSFSALQSRMHVNNAATVDRLRSTTPVTYLAFDLLEARGQSLLDQPYSERRKRLVDLGINGDWWQVPPATQGDGQAMFAASQKNQLEGIVMKRLDSRYVPGQRSKAWLKLKNFKTQEVVIAGWKPGEGNRAGLVGSLLLGVPDDDGELRYAGHVGTGFTDSMLRALQEDLAPLTTDEAPFLDPVPRPHAKDARWVRPELVGEVQFGEWTGEGRLRHPSWRGMRLDKTASEVRREP